MLPHWDERGSSPALAGRLATNTFLVTPGSFLKAPESKGTTMLLAGDFPSKTTSEEELKK
jgi:hypothetical protein